jgi:uncharacterized protein (TIGR02996 family)
MVPRPQALEQAFLDDIVAHPEDASLWLILADWLTERDDPRAELVRLTWQLQYEPAHADFPARQQRVQALLAGGMVPVRPRCILGDFEFAWIPPGSFLMGNLDFDRQGLDEAPHWITLSAGFWMGIYPVTQGQWQPVMGTNPSYFSRQGEGEEKVREIGTADLERFPVENLSWEMACDFRDRLAKQLGRNICLPTEAQWEYACRAGTTSAFHFGEFLNGHQANADGRNPFGTTETGPFLDRTSPVGLEQYPPNAWGLYDMHGNVLEWCQDAYREDYESLPAVDPLHVGSQHSHRVTRGGCWYSNPHGCRSALRLSYEPSDRSKFFGLRVCCLLD